MSTTPTSTIGTAARTRASGRSPSSAHATYATTTTCRLPSTVASPAPTSAIAWCQKIRSAAKNTPASAVSRHAPRGRGPSRCRSQYARAPSGTTAYAQRKNADVSGETFASRTRIAENAIVSAPAIANATGLLCRTADRVLAQDVVERRALGGGAARALRGGDELRRVQAPTVVR